MLEGPTGTSKTKTVQVLCDLQNLKLIRINLSSETTIEDLMGRLISDKDNSFSGFTYKEGAFAEAYSKGKVLLLDEVNLAPNPVLQCMLTALDSDKITQSVPGIGLKTFERHKDFRIVATQNPKSGAFSTTRDRLSTKFLETFQVVEFPEFTAKELRDIAHQAAQKKNYKNEKIIEQISNFHNEWVKSEFSKKVHNAILLEI
jgi:midasin (ATPase involved in ribosome maturation)